MPSAPIKIFLVNGNPKQLRTAELSNWTGKAVAGPRSEFEGIIAREESISTGVYFLTGRDPASGRPTVYIGEAESIKDHLLFNRDVEFSSPSAAAAVVHGGHANGLIAWKNKTGKTLKEIESV